MGASTTALKPFDPVALQDTVEATAKELMLPGAMVHLHTPQGDFVFGYGSTELGVTIPPSANTHFRAASNTKTMTAAGIVQLAQEEKLRSDDPVSKYASAVPNGNNIAIGELLKMRSGQYNFTGAPELAESLDHDRRSCSLSRSNVPHYSLWARNSTIATPTMSCSVSLP